MFRLATENDKCGIAALWDDCFPDDADFRDRFLRDMFTPGTSVVYHDGAVRGMVHFTLQEYSYHGSRLPAAYVFGVGTHSDYRGRGVAQGLMRLAFEELFKRGVAVALLVPNDEGLFKFYKKLDFVTTCFVEKIEFSRSSIPESDDLVEPLSSRHAHEANGVFEEVLRHRCHLCRTPEYWRFAVSASEGWGGGALCVRRQGELVGYAVYERDDGDRVSELFAQDEAAFNALRLEILNIFDSNTAVMNAPACPHGAKPFGMARVINAEMLLQQAIRHRAGDFEIALYDPILEQNSRRYRSEGGAVTSEVLNGRAVLTPSDFTNILMEEGASPYLNLVFSNE